MQAKSTYRSHTSRVAHTPALMQSQPARLSSNTKQPAVRSHLFRASGQIKCILLHRPTLPCRSPSRHSGRIVSCCALCRRPWAFSPWRSTPFPPCQHTSTHTHTSTNTKALKRSTHAHKHWVVVGIRVDERLWCVNGCKRVMWACRRNTLASSSRANTFTSRPTRCESLAGLVISSRCCCDMAPALFAASTAAKPPAANVPLQFRSRKQR